MRKNISVRLLAVLSAGILIVGCSTNTAMNSYGISGPSIVIDSENLESNLTIKGRISGEGSTTYLFGILPMGDTHRVEGVWSEKPSLISSVFNKDHAKMEATYDALVSSGADMIIEPRYEIITQKTLLWTIVTAKVRGFKGTIDSYEHYKREKPTYMEEKYGYPPVDSPSLQIELKESK